MEAGRELDALVAEKVMELDIVMKTGPFTGLHYPWHSAEELGGIPHYSEDIAAAWEVVEKLQADGWFPRLECLVAGGWWAFLHEGLEKEIAVIADTAPLAICLAALKAKGVEVD